MYEFNLYVVDRTRSSEKAIGDLSTLLEEELPCRYSLKVIDVLQEPQLAEGDKIFATPTVVKTLPPPARRIIGDLSDRERVLTGLDLVN